MRVNFKGTRLLAETLKSDKKIIVHRGGSSSSKTYSLAQVAIIKAMAEPNIVFSVFRFSMPALKISVFRDFENLINMYELGTEITLWKTQLHYKFRNGSIIEFLAADDEQRLRGPRRTYAWINEATEIDLESFRQIVLRTKRQTFIDFNPSDPEFWGKTELEERRTQEQGDVQVITSNYTDNTFLSQAEIDEIETLKPVYDGDTLIRGDDTFFKVFGLGQYGYFAGRIFNNFKQIELVPDIDMFYIGLDFGYKNDPTAIIEVARLDKTLYIHEVAYSKGLTNYDIAAILGPYNRRSVYCDSADPKSIDELKILGINAKPALKGPDSVLAGIQLMMQHEIFISRHSSNVLKEFQRYSWHLDGNNEATNKPIEKYNHSIDAIRYVLSKTALKSRIRIL